MSRAQKSRNGESRWQKEKRKLLRLVLAHEACPDLAGGWRRWSRNLFIWLLHTAIFHLSSTQTVSCLSLSTGMAERPRENNTALMPANSEVRGWHSRKTSKLPGTNCICRYASLKTTTTLLHCNHVFFWLNYKKPITSLHYYLCEDFHGHTRVYLPSSATVNPNWPEPS